jgi:hypothetical protein
MFKRQAGYIVLAGFAAVLVVGLMLDDPAVQQAQLLNYEATRQVQLESVLYPDLTHPAQVTGLDVLDVTTGTGRLVMRDESGLWYAPSISGIQDGIAADGINQVLVEETAAALALMAAEQWFDATPANLELFGLRPGPAYRCRFRATDPTGRPFESLIEVGDANPDRVAYYVYVDPPESQRVYLVRKSIVDLLLNMLSASLQITPTPDVTPDMGEATSPGP